MPSEPDKATRQFTLRTLLFAFFPLAVFFTIGSLNVGELISTVQYIRESHGQLLDPVRADPLGVGHRFGVVWCVAGVASRIAASRLKSAEFATILRVFSNVAFVAFVVNWFLLPLGMM